MASLNTSNISEFIAHPDYQQIAAFFLGAVFITSLNYSCLWIRGFFPQLRKWMARNRAMTTDIEDVSSEKASVTSSLKFMRSGENRSLIFTLSLCFAFASIAYFGSLLSFSPNGGATCAFVVAWGGMAAQTARLIGLLVLLLELRDLGVAKLEVYLALAGLFIAMVLVFVNNAIGTGALKSFEPLGIAICYRKHFLPTALATSFMQFFLELFMLLRLGFLLVRQGTLQETPLTALRDDRIIKALSLLFLELLTIAPSAVHINVLADFIPLSIGALAVLAAFNYKSDRDNYPTLNTDVVVSAVPVALARSHPGWFSGRSFRSSSGPNNLTRAPISPQPTLPTPTTIPHPFSAQYLKDTTLAWTRQNQAQGSRVGTTETTSTRDGVFQAVERSGAPTRARVNVVSSTDIEPMPRISMQRPPDIPQLPGTSANVTSAEPPLPALPSAYSASLSPTSLLMHPWHERRRPESVRVTSRFSLDESVESTGAKSPVSTRRGSERTSYMLRGFPMPPVPSPSAPMRRYSSATLTSPISSQEGGEGGQTRQHVQLLTFESTFRKSGERSAYRTPFLSTDPLAPAT